MAMELDASGLSGSNGAQPTDRTVTLVADTTTTAQSSAPHTVTIALEAGDIVHLPAGTDISHMVQVGNDLEFIQPDGTVIIIPNGAVADLTLFVGNVEIPADTVAALYQSNDIHPAEGGNSNNQHAHGNFSHNPGGIGDAFGLTGLLGPTELSFSPNDVTTPEDQNLPPIFDGPLAAAVSEEALPEGHEEPDQPDDAFDSTSFTHSLGVSDPNGDPLTFTIGAPTGLSSGGVALTWTTTTSGSVTTLMGSVGGENVISVSIDASTKVYSVNLLGPVDHLAVGEDVIKPVFEITAHDPFGGTASTTLTVSIEDDTPTGLDATPATVLDDDAQTVFTGNAGGSGDVPDAKSVSGAAHSLFFAGADGEKAVALTGKPDFQVIYNNGGVAGHEGVTWDSGVVSGTVTTFTATSLHYGSGSPAATLVVNADGSYTFTLNAPIVNGPGTSDGVEETTDLKFGLTITDGDGDTATASLTVGVNDDTPTVVASVAALADGLDFGSFAPNNNEWGQGSGTATGTNGGWTIAGSETDNTADGAVQLSNAGTGTIQLERVGDGYDGMHSSTHGYMADLDASPHDIEISQKITGLSAGETTVLHFEAGVPVGGTGTLEVWFGGQLIETIDPTTKGVMTGYSITLTGGSGDHSDLLEFREVGTPDNVGTYLANVSVGGIIIDETAGIQGDSSEVAALSIFDSVVNPGAEMPAQYAQGSSPAVAVNAQYGADGPAASNALVYDLSATNGADSGLKTTDGHEIYLYNENGLVVGRYESDGSGGITTADKAAFAFTVDATTGVISMVQYVSLYHGDTTSPNDTVQLAAGSLNVTVTVTDGDGDTAHTTVDVSKEIEFRDDGPTLVSGQQETGTANEDDIETLHPTWFGLQGSDGTSPNDGNWDGSYTGSPGSNGPGPAEITGNLAHLVNFGADGAGDQEFQFDSTQLSYLTGLHLSSKGDELSYQIKDGVLYGFDNAGGAPGTSYDPQNGDRLVFTLSLDSHTGGYTFSLYDQLDHDAPYDDSGDHPDFSHGDTWTADQNVDLQDKLPATADVSAIDFGKLINAIDGDGDSVNLGDSFKIAIRDDIPKLSGRQDVEIVDEDDIDTRDPHSWHNPGSLGTSPDDGDRWDGSFTGNSHHESGGPADVSGNLQYLVKVGADETYNGGASFSFVSENAARDYLDSLGLSSQGHELSYDIKDGVLYAFDNAGPSQGTHYDPQSDRLVFTLQVQSDGDYTFKLYDQLDHDAPYDDQGDHKGYGDTWTADQNFDLQDDLAHRDVDAIDFGKIIQASDFDGDSVNLGDSFKIAIRDDIPELSGRHDIETVDEGDIDTVGYRDGNTGWTTIAGSLGTSPDDGDWRDGSFTGNPNRENGGPANVSGNLQYLVDVGADETPNGGANFSFVDAGWAVDYMASLGLKSQGDALSYQIKNGVLYAFDNAGDQPGHSYDPQNGDRLVFTLSLHSDGDYTFNLYDQLDHTSSGAGEDKNFDLINAVPGPLTAIDFGKIIKASDFDGDSVNLGDKFQIAIRDDIPTFVHAATEQTVDEKYLDNAHNAPVLGLIDIIGGSTGSDPDYADGDTQGNVGGPLGWLLDPTLDGSIAATGSLAGTVNFGADEPGRFILAGSVDSLLNQHIDSKGDALEYATLTVGQHSYVIGYVSSSPSTDSTLQALLTDVGEVLSGQQPTDFNLGNIANLLHTQFRLVFTLDVNTDGNYQFRLFDQLDHGAPGSGTDTDLHIDFSSLIGAQDFDGDTLILPDHAFTVDVKDDVPVVSLSETGKDTTIDETGGHKADNTTSNSVESLFSGVTQTVGTTSSLPTAFVFAHGDHAVVAATVTGADEPNPVTLKLALTAPSVGGTEASGLTTTDGHAITLSVDTSGRVIGTDDTGRVAFAIALDQSGQVSIAQYLALHQNDPGDPNDPVDLTGKVSVVATATDYDGDTSAPKSIDIGDAIVFRDDGPSVRHSPTTLSGVSEADLPNGNDPTPHASTSTTATSLGVDWGADDDTKDSAADTTGRTLSFVASALPSGLKSDGVDLDHTIVSNDDGGQTVIYYKHGGSPTNVADEVFTVTLDPHADHGGATFDLLGNLDDGNKSSKTLTFSFTATDSDGDTASQTGKFSVTVADDGPAITAADIQNGAVDEDALGGNAGDSYPETSVPLELSGVLHNTSNTFGTAGDIDATDTAHGSLGVHWGADDGAGRTLTFDHSALPTGLTIDGGTPVHIWISADGTKAEGYTGTVSTSEPTDPVFTVTLDASAANGAYSFVLHQPLDEPVANQEDSIELSFGFIAKDSDGDQAKSSFTVTVNDDAPVAHYLGLAAIQESADAGGAFIPVTRTGTLPYSVGADGGSITHLSYRFAGATNVVADGDASSWHTVPMTSGGLPVNIYTDTSVTGHITLIGYTGSDASANHIFTFDVNQATGAYTYTQSGPLDHPDAGTDGSQIGTNDPVVLTFDYIVTDKDGDNATNAVNVAIDDSGPSVAATGDAVTVSEDGLDDSNKTGGSYDAPVKVTEASGSLHVDFGADDGVQSASSVGFGKALTFNLSQDGVPLDQNGVALALTSGGVALTYAVTSDASGIETLTAAAGNHTVFTVTLDPTSSNGSYTFDLVGPLDHIPVANTDTLALNFGVTASDADHDTVQQNFTVTVQDDTPVIEAPTNFIDNGNFTQGDWPNTASWGASTTDPLDWTLVGSRLERVYDGYGGATSSNGAPMVDLEATPDDVAISQQVHGLETGQHYKLSFEISRASFGDGTVLVSWNGTDHTFHPSSGPTQLITLDVLAQGNNSDVLSFKETGNTSDNSGTFLTNVSLVPVNGIVDEEGLATAATQDDAYPGDVPGHSLVASGNLGIQWGADNANATAATALGDRGVSFAAMQTDLASLHLTSNGQALTYLISPDGTTLSGVTATNTPVFTVALSDADDGHFTFTLLSNLDHPIANVEDSLDLTFRYVATDSDGDTANGSFVVAVNDDAPVIGATTVPAWFSDDFDSGLWATSGGYFDGVGNGYGTVQTYASGAGPQGIATKSGSGNYALLGQTGTLHDDATGPYTRFDDYKKDFLGGFVAKVDVYIDPTSWGANNGFDYSVAAQQQDGTFLRDFIFHLTSDGTVVHVGASNNSGDQNGPESPAQIDSGTHSTISAAGWYTLEQVFHQGSDGALAVDLVVLDATGTTVFTQTLSDSSDLIANVAGGNLYGWFTTITVPNGLPVDNVSLSSLDGVAEVNEDDLASIGTVGTPEPVSVTGQFHISWGADDGTKHSLAFGAGVVPPAGLTSHGVALSYWVSSDGTELVAYRGTGATSEPAAADQVFTITLDGSGTGSYTFTLLSSLDHPAGNGQNDLPLSFGFVATDSDGDSASSSFTVNVHDDVPVIAAATNLIVNGSFELSDGSLQDGQWGLYHHITGWDAVAGANGVVPFEIQDGNVGGIGPEDGQTKVELDSDINGANSAFGAHTSPTSDGHYNDTGHTNATIQQDVATEAGQTYLLTFWYAPRDGETGSDSAGMDVLWNGQVVKSIDSTGMTAGVWQEITVVVTGTGGSDALGFRGAGAEDSFGAYIDNVSLVATPAGWVDEDGLPGGNSDPAPGDVVLASPETMTHGALGIQWGADNNDSATPDTLTNGIYTQDAPAAHSRSVTFANTDVTVVGGTLTSHGDTITLALANDGAELIGTAEHDGQTRTVFTASLSDDGTGQFAFVLQDALDHTAGNHENDMSLSFNFTATDSDGDSASGSFSVVVNDDTPVTVADTDSISEDGTAATGNVVTGTYASVGGYAADNNGTDGSADRPGADGFKSIQWATDNGSHVISGAYGSLHADAAGNYAYVPGQGAQSLGAGASAVDTFTYTLTDGDGDVSAPTTLKITVEGVNDAPAILSSNLGSINEAGDIQPAVSEAGIGGALSIGSTVASLAQSVLAALDAHLPSPPPAPASVPVVITQQNIADAIDGVMSAASVDKGTAIAVVWQNMDSLYGSHGANDTNLNAAFLYLGLDYAAYVKAGGEPLLDVTAKYVADGSDPDTLPDRMQSLHDNLLGNLTDYALHQRYDAAGLYSTMLMLVDNQDSTLPSRTVEPVTGNEGAANGSTVADGHAFDLTHGYATHASGQLAANDPDTGDNTNLSWSVANGAGTYGTFSVDTTGKWTYVLDDARTATQALGQGEHGTETFNVTVTDGHGGTTTQAVTITVDGTNDAPVITTAAGEASATLYASGALSNVVTADVAGDHAFHFEEPGSGPRMDPALETMIANLIATNTDPSNNTMNMQAVLAGVQAVLGHAAGEADAIAAVWTYIDDVYTSSAGYYKTALNAVGVRLGIAYAEYIDAGGEPLTNVIVKYHPDGADGNGTDGIPDRLQSMHDNLLGAVDTPSIDDKFSADPVLLTVLKAEIAAAGLTDRPIYSGDESGIQSNKAATVAWDQDNGLLPGGTHQVVTGQLTATDVDDNDVGKLTWSANHLNGTYGTFTLDSTTGQWTYTLDASLAATRALGANDVATDSFVATVADLHGGSANETVTVTVHGTNDAPTLDLDGSAAGTGYETTFTPGGNAVAIAAGDTTIADVDSTMMSRAVIVLTNAQSGDVLSVGQLSPNMSFTMDTSLAGQITVTINGAATLANYDAAIESVKFSTSSSSSLDRWFTVAVDDDQGATSNTATSIIHSAGSTIDVVDGPYGLQFAWNGNSDFDHPHNNGTVTGFDTVSDYASATKLVFPIAPTLAANVSASGADHASFLDYDNGTGNTIHAHSITNGVVTFYSDTAGTDPITLANDQNHNGLAAAVDYLMRNDLGAAGATVVFNVGSDSFVFEQGADTPYLASTSAPPDHSASGDSTDILVKLTGQSNPSTIAAEIGSGHKIDPIILDLDGNGVHLNAAASFDLANSGQASTFAWPGTTDGILVADLDHSGTIQNGSEVFSPSFGGGDYATSLDALKTYDSNGDGKITADDAKFGDIGVWVDANGNGVSDAGEVHSLSDLGIAGIDLGANEVDFDIDGQHVFAQGTFELSTGETSDYVGVDLGAPLPDLTGDPTAADAGIGVPPEVTGAIHAGTAGVDNFALTDLHAVDFIADYNFGQGDTVDLSALLGHNSGATAANAADYVKVDGNTVAVDTSGSGHDFVDVAVLNHPVPDVKVILDDGVDVTISHIINQNG